MGSRSFRTSHAAVIGALVGVVWAPDIPELATAGDAAAFVFHKDPQPTETGELAAELAARA